MKLRAVTDKDYEGVVALIEAAYGEYGERLCLEGADSDLVGLPSAYTDGSFMVLEDDGAVRGTVAVVPNDDFADRCFLRRLYLWHELRGSGWAQKLVAWAIDRARSNGMTRMELWSDTRFTRAHAFYQKLGFVHEGIEREMNDALEPYREYFYYLDL